ncbi:glycerol kinase/xylulokinase [Acididesulfobacillus acetoxydans]|uniref:Xylulose kinase n=1 Tax=Acididesulfobacillus acetoxydans TaxID=1561005 RepID=A0A8S0XCL5_9FIRM|nr:xylulokinase [Acididesulfobacillus acetoxydans]CAA7602606.1 glycerol kinase/xylulokinase [Acididesulfobacillus acetoxydans]CEJ07247.1 Xylulose kinase [Acididesulfobacillus acetoxydans]
MINLAGIDIGTSGTKVVLIDDTGRILASAYKEYPMAQPRPGWAEQDPELWWQAAAAGMREVLTKSGLSGQEVQAVGLSGQMHGAVLLDKDYELLRPAILWCDQRTGAECEWMNEELGTEKLFAWSGNPALPGFTAPKLLWLRRHEPEIYARIKHVLLPKDYVRWRLTGELATEVSDASGTLLLDVTKRRWSEEMLAALAIPRAWLPPVYESTEISGWVTPVASSLTGLKPGTAVVGGGGDQAAGAVGAGIVESGLLSVALGTSGVVFAAADEAQILPGSGLHSFCHALPGKWHLMGVMLAAGASLQWLRQTLACKTSYDSLTALAAGVKAGSEGLLYLPYLLGERTPYPDPAARGGFIGLTMRHGQGHLVRAVLEGVTYGLRDSLELIKEAGVPAAEIRVSGGGARSALWRQIVADIFQAPVTVVNSTEGPAFGAALLAGTGIGVYASVAEACGKTVRVESRQEPDLSAGETYEKGYALYRSLYPLLRETMHGLATEFEN